MRLPAPDPLSTILLYVAAIIMAANQALSTSSALTLKFPALKMSGTWNYVPLALLTVVFIVWFIKALAPVTPAVGVRAVAPNVATAPRTDRPRSAMAPISAPPKPDRVYLPQSFTDRYHELIANSGTELQVEALLTPQRNHWMRLRGKLKAVDRRDDGFIALVSLTGASDMIFVFFDKIWGSQLALIHRGDEIVFEAMVGDQLPKLSSGELL